MEKIMNVTDFATMLMDPRVYKDSEGNLKKLNIKSPLDEDKYKINPTQLLETFKYKESLRAEAIKLYQTWRNFISTTEAYTIQLVEAAIKIKSDSNNKIYQEYTTVVKRRKDFNKYGKYGDYLYQLVSCYWPKYACIASGTLLSDIVDMELLNKQAIKLGLDVTIDNYNCKICIANYSSQETINEENKRLENEKSKEQKRKKIIKKTALEYSINSEIIELLNLNNEEKKQFKIYCSNQELYEKKWGFREYKLALMKQRKEQLKNFSKERSIWLDYILYVEDYTKGLITGLFECNKSLFNEMEYMIIPLSNAKESFKKYEEKEGVIYSEAIKHPNVLVCLYDGETITEVVNLEELFCFALEQGLDISYDEKNNIITIVKTPIIKDTGRLLEKEINN